MDFGFNTQVSRSPTTTGAPVLGHKCSAKAQNARYYIQDTSIVVFEVENELFRVHRHFFTAHSPFFRTLFSLPQGDDQRQQKSGEGTDTSPLLLPDVPKAQLEILLDYFYEGVKFGHRLEELSLSLGPAKASERRITLLLDLFYIANRYEFASIRQDALQRIEAIRVSSRSNFAAIWSPIDRIVLATRFSVEEWLMPAYEELCKRDDFITLDEAERIGGRKTAVIALARERFKRAHEAAVGRLSQPVTVESECAPKFSFSSLSNQPPSSAASFGFGSSILTPSAPPVKKTVTAKVTVDLSAIIRSILSSP